MDDVGDGTSGARPESYGAFALSTGAGRLPPAKGKRAGGTRWCGVVDGKESPYVSSHGEQF